MVKHLISILLFLSFLSSCLAPDDIGDFVPPTADEDPNLPQTSIHVAGHTRKIHIETFGDPDNPPLFVLHGSLADYRSMREFFRLSELGYLVVLWDQRGNGLSERIGSDEIGDRFVLEEIDQLKERYGKNRQITLLGHSFGAMYASYYAAQNPDQVAKLVLLEPAGLTGELFTKHFPEVFQLKLFNDELSKTFWQNDLLGPSDHEQLDYKALMLLQSGDLLNYYCDPDSLPALPIWRPGAYYDHIRNKKLQPHTAGRFEFDYVDGIQDFKGEVLLLGSECSAIGWEFQENFHLPLFPNARSHRIQNAGHRLMIEQAEEVFEAVSGFLLNQ